MIKRISTLSISFMFLLMSLTGTLSISARATGNQPLSKEQIKALTDRSIEDARKSAVYDAAGRMSKTTVVLPELGQFTFEYKYDEQNQLQYISDEKGGLTQFKYNEKGELQSITLPNDVSMYELGKDGKGVFFKNGVNPVKRNSTARPLDELDMQDPERCKQAVAALALAIATSAAACAAGPSVGCALAVAGLAVAASAAYSACKSQDALPMEPPQV